MGRSQRRKGHNWERRIVRWLKKLGIESARRNLGETGGQDLGADVVAQLRLPPPALDHTAEWRLLVVQAKHHKAPSVWKAMNEVRTGMTSPSDIAVAIVKRTNDQTLVCMDPDTFSFLITGKVAPL